MTQVTVNLTDTFEDWRVKTNTLGTNQGDLATLTTTATNSMVAAINEIDATATEISLDTSPQLGGNLDVLARIITTSTTNGNIAITPNGSGNIVLDGLTFPNADSTANYFLKTNGAGVLAFAQVPTAGIAVDAITGTQLADNACDSEHYTDGSIDLAHLATDCVDGTKIADDAINSEHYAAASIDNEHLADDAVGVPELSATGTASNTTFLRGDNSWQIADSTSASDLTSGTLPDGRFPATLPAGSGINLTALNASNLGSGTLPDARFPATLPAISGAALTDTIYDISFTAGFDSDMVKEDVAVATYGEMVMARAGTFVGEAGYVDTAATGSTCTVDIFKNGTTIYSTRPTFAIASTGVTAGTLSTTTFAANDRITFKVTAIGSSAAGQGIRFTLKCKV